MKSDGIMFLFFRVEAGKDAFVTTDELPQKVFTGPSKGTPNIRSLYRKPSSNSTAIRIAVNSDPNVEVSTVFCALEYHKMGERFRKMRIPVCDRHVNLFPA